ncbi:hypothetical protein LzC2_35570 [Planctomycetes bacterium LzC2]|uniref:Uncharacterized protein n=1 Tax=Alienimonas chondri TaxID=2681879 RepID=A0ABX1VJR9_9PLAN|nr:hypothetical protein [Alienimonas chondri]
MNLAATDAVLQRPNRLGDRLRVDGVVIRGEAVEGVVVVANRLAPLAGPFQVATVRDRVGQRRRILKLPRPGDGDVRGAGGEEEAATEGDEYGERAGGFGHGTWL